MKLTVVSNTVCGGDITYQPESPNGYYYRDDVVTIQVIPRPGYAFEGWTDNVEGIEDTTASIVTVVMTGHRTITPNFTPLPATLTYPVTVTSNPSEGGSVRVSTPCGSFKVDRVQNTLSLQCPAGIELNLTATASRDHRFVGWTGDLSDSQESVTLVIDSARTIAADFTYDPEPGPFAWWKVAGGVTAALLVLIALVFLVRARAGRAKNDQSA
jgi:uncharacterized repeat protein (TIGR02543 family)